MLSLSFLGCLSRPIHHIIPNEQMGEDEVKLFRTWSSRFAMRVVHGLVIKGIQYDAVFEDFIGKGKSAELLAMNPVYKKVPVLVHNGRPVCESLIILEYIDETWSHRPLLPRDPYDRATARFWAQFGDKTVLPLVSNILSVQPHQREEAIAQATKNFKLLEDQLQHKGTKFFGGEEIGYLDIALGWLANLIGIMEEVLGLKLMDAEALPLLSTWMARFANDPVIKDLWPPHDRMIMKFKAMVEHHSK